MGRRSHPSRQKRLPRWMRNQGPLSAQKSLGGGPRLRRSSLRGFSTASFLCTHRWHNVVKRRRGSGVCTGSSLSGSPNHDIPTALTHGTSVPHSER